MGIGLRELSPNEFEEYCVNNTRNRTEAPEVKNLNPDKLNYTRDFWIRILTAGCYYINPVSGVWSSQGMEVLEENTNFEWTNCESSHLTDFAGGLVVLPSQINFEYVFANSSFDKNPTIYTTVILTLCAYFLGVIWCVLMDKKDKLKAKIHLLSDNKKEETYFYEINIYTGTRKNAGTKSRVYVNLMGSLGESSVRELRSNDKIEVFKRSAVDTFIMSVKRPLGSLDLCRIYHDNSAKKRKQASWFLKHIIIKDLQTNESFIFICEKW